MRHLALRFMKKIYQEHLEKSIKQYPSGQPEVTTKIKLCITFQSNSYFARKKLTLAFAPYLLCSKPFNFIPFFATTLVDDILQIDQEH